MAGILAVAAYVPRYRLPREVIAQEWGGAPAAGRARGREPRRGQPDAGGQRRRRRSGARRPRPRRSSSRPPAPPYAEKQGAATIAAVLDLPPPTRTLDVGRQLRAGTSAILAALDAVAGGAAARVLVAPAECRHGRAGIGRGAELRRRRRGAAASAARARTRRGGRHAHASPTTSSAPGGPATQDFPHTFPGAFETKLGYAPRPRGGREGRPARRPASAAARSAPPSSCRRRIRARRSPSPRPSASTRSASSQDALWTTVGDTGAAQPLAACSPPRSSGRRRAS